LRSRPRRDSDRRRAAKRSLSRSDAAYGPEYFEWLVEIGNGERTLTDDERAAFYLRHDIYWV
jgi:hypothetical protein